MIYHGSANNGSNNFGGINVEASNISNPGKRYGNTKLEYEFSGKAIKITNKSNDEFISLLNNLKNNSTGETFISRAISSAMDTGLSLADITKAVQKGILRKFGYDAIAVAPEGNISFLSILNLNNTQGRRFIRGISS